MLVSEHLVAGWRATVVAVMTTTVAFTCSSLAQARSGDKAHETSAQVPAAGEPRAKPPDDQSYRPSDFNLSVLGGRGLLQTRSPYTLGPGKVAVGGSVLN